MIPLFSALVLAAAVVPTGIDNLSVQSSDISPLTSLPPSFSEMSYPLQNHSDGSTVMILVANYLSSPLSAQINQLQADMSAEGWNVVVSSMAGGTAADIRSLFQSTPDLDGAVLIGFLPCAWYEEDYWANEEFPCELFLMDLDGIWGDADGDGLYDSHTGDVAPEIWIGRIDAHAAEFGSEVLMLANYFEKNHLYRTGAMSPPSRALTYIDDDWSGYTSCGLNSIYGAGNVTVVNSEVETTASNYLSRLSEGYEFVHLMAHSSPWGHTFKIPSGMAGTVMAPEIAQVNPNTAFLQLFSCSNARWIEAGCLGNWYLFGTDTGLLVSGAAKTGSMLDFEYFYTPIGSGSCFGEAFRDWWTYQASGGFSSSERAWFYGNALLGDPTLKPVASDFISTGITASPGYTDAFAVSTGNHSDCFPVAVTSDGVTAVAWLTGQNGRLDIAARFHDDSSDSWSQIYTVDADEYWDSGVSVCFDDSGEPWLAWSDFEYATYSYRIKTAHGIPFENVTVAAPQDGYQVAPDIAHTDRMWLAWQDWESTGGRIMVKTLEGSPFSAQVSEPGSWASAPAVSHGHNGKLNVVWVKNTTTGSSIMWSQGDQNGFTTPVTLSSSSDLSHSPDIAFLQNKVIAVWQVDGIESSLVVRTYDGSQWSAEVEVIKDSQYHLSNPVICPAPSGNPAICWQQGRAAATAWASVLNTSGNWSAPFQPVTPAGPVWNPVFSGGRMFWAGSQGADWNIYCETIAGVGEGEPSPAASIQLQNNPVAGSLTINLTPGSIPFIGRVSVFDLSGRSVVETQAEISLNQRWTLDCSGLPTGIYSLRAEGVAEPIRFTLLR